MRAARVVRFISTVYGVALVCMLLAACVLQPASLTIAYLRLDPSSFINAAIMRVLVLSILFWGTRELTNAMALEAPGGPRKMVTPTRLAVLIGVALSVIVVWIGMKITNGQTGRHAKELAANQLGPGYEYYVTSLKEMSSGQGTSIKGEVTAWNDKELQTLSVQWQSVMPVK